MANTKFLKEFPVITSKSHNLILDIILSMLLLPLEYCKF